MDRLIIVFAATAFFLGLCYLMGGSLYDLQKLKATKQRHQGRKTAKRPLISIVLVSSVGDPAKVSSSLASVIKSTYRKYEVLVVNLGSAAAVTAAVKQFKVKHPKKTIKTTSSKVVDASNNLSLLRHYKGRQKGELIILVPAGVLLDKSALKQAADYFDVFTNTDVLIPNSRQQRQPSLLSLVLEFASLISHRWDKFKSVVNMHNLQTKSCIVVRKAALSVNFQHTRPLKARYGSQLVIFNSPPTSTPKLMGSYFLRIRAMWLVFFSRQPLDKQHSLLNSLSRWSKLLFSLLVELFILVQPLILAYSLYIAFSARYSALLGFGWLIFSALLLFTVWTDEILTFTKKLKLALLAPMIFGPYYLASALRSISTLFSLLILSINSLLQFTNRQLRRRTA